ncbi:MAG TPA: FtsX-like permease family protein [Blastocatellia bacterium]|nr:FtsX-like permease family protein [Blastocatellia bacterium]
MRISTIAFANLKRRKGKALFLIVGISIGIGTAVALLSLSGSIREEIGSQLDRFGANILVVPQSNSLSLDYGGIPVSSVAIVVHQLTSDDAVNIRDIEYRDRLSIIAPKILSAVSVESQEVLLAGVDFENELSLKRWWHIVGTKPASEADLLAGYEVARALSLIEDVPDAHPPGAHSDGHHATGLHQFRIKRDVLKVAGREHRVSGVLSPTGGPEDRMIFGQLAHVQSLLGRPGQLSLIEVSALCNNCPVEDIVAQISARLPHTKVSAIQQSVRARAETVARLTRFSAAVSIVVLAIGALMIFTTMMGSVIERTREIGVLRAIGFRRTHIMKGLVIEVAAVSAIGGLLGWAAGVLASWAVLPYFSEEGTQIAFRPELAIAAVAAGLLIGIFSSLYPIVRASRLDPSEAVRYV